MFENEERHYSEIKEEIDGKKREDAQRERERVRAKHLKKKQRE